ncbi:MAG TPA: hypothetical protein DCL43_16170 [Chitinophagaceae bacterium]|nr:hypothetical protein [Chitinophagaceae bacterium]HAN37757.1 hypothetical protein [Chitinophagaceae bacterium]
MMATLQAPWPWYIAGIIIGLIVPALLLLGNKHFGISANFRHICAACFPGNVSFFKYNWRKEVWNFFFLGGIVIGAIIASTLLKNPNPIEVHPALKSTLATYGITDYNVLVPQSIMGWQALTSVKGWLLMVLGGFLVGFGTRYAGGCTSGHAINGISNLSWPSLVATCCFMIGGFIMVQLILPYILSL